MILGGDADMNETNKNCVTKTFEELKFISETHRELFAQRQKYEWRVIFSTLTFFVVAIAFKYSKDSFFPKDIYSNISIYVFVWDILILWDIVVIWFLYNLHKANATNRAYAELAEKIIIQMVNNENLDEYRIEHVRQSLYAFYSQMAMIIILSITTGFFLTLPK